MADADAGYAPAHTGSGYAPESVARLVLGPYFFGFMVQLWLYGLFINLLLNYLSSKTYKRDRRLNQVLIWGVAGLHTLATALNAYLAVYHGCDQDRSYEALFHVTLWDQLQSLPVGVMGCVVQAYLAVRASQLFRHAACPRALFLALLAAAIVCELTACVMVQVIAYAFVQGRAARFAPFTYNMAAATWLWLSAAVDVALTATLVVCLRRSAPGFRKRGNRNSAITSLTRTALRSAVPTAVVAVIGAVLNVGWGTEASNYSDLFQMASTPLVSLYALSLLTTLNARKPARRQQQQLASAPAASSGAGGARSGASPAPAGGRTLSRMSFPSVQLRLGPKVRPALPIDGGIQFTRDVVETVELSDEPDGRLDGQPDLASYRPTREPLYGSDYRVEDSFNR